MVRNLSFLGFGICHRYTRALERGGGGTGGGYRDLSWAHGVETLIFPLDPWDSCLRGAVVSGAECVPGRKQRYSMPAQQD